MSEEQEYAIEPLKKLSRDLKKAAASLTTTQARYLVDAYYQMQNDRIRSSNQVRQMQQSEEPHELLTWLAENTSSLERSLKGVLGVYAAAHPAGKWAQGITGIGPVISAGLLAHIDLEPWRCQRVRMGSPFYDAKVKKACTAQEPHGPECQRERIATVGHIWRFAGLDPTVTWNPKEKRPWNGDLKRLCWLIGESFTRVQANKHDFYGKLFKQRKVQEEQRNAEGLFAEQAAKSLATKDWKRDTATRAHYEAGKLPPARLHLRAQRWATKLFLAHYHAVAYRAQFGVEAPKPYVLTHLGHADEIRCPNWPF